ncbi:MAG: YigZ family protein [Lachnospiraceae bacterium]|nr:YigZ family protein [Lachnospiraceae bacterium]
MQEKIKYLYQGGQGEIEEKKSRFIATLRPVQNEEEAAAFIGEMKKKYWDARHNCSAFVIGEHGETTRCSDDGEPSGTAGRPMLEVLKNSGVKNAAVVVTRYFGGVLLGTGGLVRAYTDAVKAGLNNCVIIEQISGLLCRVRIDYTDLGRLQHLFASEPFTVYGTSYEEKVLFELLLPDDAFSEAEKAVTEATGGRVAIVPEKKCRYAKTADGIIVSGEESLAFSS